MKDEALDPSVNELKRISSTLSEANDPRSLLAELVAHTPIPFLLYRPDGLCVATNRAFRELMGMDVPAGYNILADEAAGAAGIGDLFGRTLAGEVVERPPHWFDAALLPGVTRRVGVRSWFFPLYDAEGVVQLVAACCTEATAELLLQAERDRQQVLRDCSEEVTIVTDLDGKITYVSPSCTRVLGYSPEEIVQLGGDLLHPDQEAPCVEAHRRVRSVPGTTIHTECRLRHKDGSDRWMSLTSIHIAGHPTLEGIITHMHDVTVQKAAEVQQRRTARMLEEALDMGRSVAWSGDMATGKLSFVGKTAERLGLRTGMTREEHLARFHPDERDHVWRHMTGVRDGEIRHASRHRLRMLHAETGEPIWVEVSAAPIFDAGGHNLGTRGITTDITERVRGEEIAVRAAKLEAENNHIRAVSQLKSELLAHLSHELRTPLNAIIGFGELLHDGAVDPSSPDHKEFLGTIVQSGRHLLALIGDLLDLAKIEAGKLDLSPAPVHLPALVAEVCESFRLMVARRRIVLVIEHDPAVSEVVVDPRRMKQVLFNYVSNALKFTAEGGRVTVRTRAEGPDAFRLEVEDTGIGIAPGDMARLFKEFERLRAGAGHPDGAGLGLALTRSLVEDQGGSVGVKSVLGQGSTFHAVLPRDVAAARRDARPPSSRRGR